MVVAGVVSEGLVSVTEAVVTGTGTETSSSVLWSPLNDQMEQWNANQKTMGPKPACTLWPYGQADDSAGSDQRVGRPGHDDQTLGK